ncbi:MAG: zinc-ribbon domain-containing protein [Dehalococcoidia bacterium]|nr:zinc-ribbon domain-containing protein [Dehalococcoidia bacterium]
MFCCNCGAEHDDNAAFCSQCGVSIGTIITVNEQNRNKPYYSGLSVATLILGIITFFTSPLTFFFGTGVFFGVPTIIMGIMSIVKTRIMGHWDVPGVIGLAFGIIGLVFGLWSSVQAGVIPW